MSMQRSDLPHLSKLPVDVQRQVVDAVWRVYNTTEQHSAGPKDCPVTWVATMAEMAEAVLATAEPWQGGTT